MQPYSQVTMRRVCAPVGVCTPVCACVCSRCQPPTASELTGTGRLRAHSRSLSSHARARAHAAFCIQVRARMCCLPVSHCCMPHVLYFMALLCHFQYSSEARFEPPWGRLASCLGSHGPRFRRQIRPVTVPVRPSHGKLGLGPDLTWSTGGAQPQPARLSAQARSHGPPGP